MPNNRFNQIVSGIFTSKLIYCITCWGGLWNLPDQQTINRQNTAISENGLRKLEILQNKVMHLMTGLDFYTPTKDLLKSSKQLSVHQLVAYHTCCQVFKIESSKLPSYHYERLFLNPDENMNRTGRNKHQGSAGKFNYLSGRLP